MTGRCDRRDVREEECNLLEIIVILSESGEREAFVRST